ncbi:uncharacterized protein LOC121807045 [Salvia splendens]|uniref:uncharacterized protein LOC121807045 n=1 Tax=Salvia splendens TaxID=180675 RepID=UPI001C26E749|nr:uncharacterized protein LOC121807045 [Salvia splendens]
MATSLPASSLQLPKPDPTFPSQARAHQQAVKFRAAPEEQEESFEERLSQVRLRYRSGSGKKAEVRKSRKGKKSGSGASVFLPPVALKEPKSEGLNVEFGFSPYSERVNGRIAILGLSALFLVELATGQGVINYHTPSIVFLQIYFVAALSAIYLKFQKESISVWPK